MNKIFITAYCSAVLVLLVLSACLKQNLGDYKPDSVNDLNIGANLEDSYELYLDDVLQLDASLAQSNGNGTIAYQWYYYSAGDYSVDERVNVSNSSKLDLTIDMNTGNYFLVVESTDTKTGVKGYKKMNLTVKSPTSEGWLLLTWKNNKANLSIVSSDNKVFKGFLQPSADYSIDSKPEKLICINDWDKLSQPIVITTTKPNIYFLDHNTFEIKQDGPDSFLSPLNLKVTNYGTDIYNNAFYMWDDNGLVYTASRGGTIDFPDGFDEALPGDYKASKWVIPVGSMYPVPAVFYDEKGKRFVYHDAARNDIRPFGTKPADAPFDMNRFTDEIKFADNGSDEMSYIVGKNALGEYHLYTMSLYEALDIYPAKAVDKLDIIDKGKATFFTVSGKLSLLYYVADNQLFVYKIGQKKSTLLYTFPTDETVSALSMLRGKDWFSASPAMPFIDNRLGIATNKGDNGVFYTFDLTATGAIRLSKYSTRDEGFDPIVDIAYKMMK